MIANEPLAIVGMSCWVPGAENLDEYWKLLVQGRSALGELPDERLNRRLYYNPRKGTRCRTYTTLGGVTSDRPLDPSECPIPDHLREAANPVHLKLCKVAADACRHAGYDPLSMPESNTGVYIGHTPPALLGHEQLYLTQIWHLAQHLREVEGIDILAGNRVDEIVQEVVDRTRAAFADSHVHPRTNSNAANAAMLVSQMLRCNGPVMSLDAACASSLRALSQGARALQLGQIDTAIVGGASVCNTNVLVQFSAAQSISATGSRPFDDTADGLLASEGYAIVILKMLHKALDDGDRIQAIIRGIGISSDGKGKSLWAPMATGQICAMRRAYPQGLSPGEMHYIEAHATSTQLGDATELNALAEVLREALPEGKRIPVGSVKANIGHTLETAGLASLIKTVLSMQKGMIPPQINIRSLNRKIDWENVPFLIPVQPMSWPETPAAQPRFAAVNAFGIGGLNVHVVLEYLPRQGASPRRNGSPTGETVGVSGSPRELDPIAIIGRGVIVPGARTIAAFEELLFSGVDQRRTIMPDRWDASIGCDGRSVPTGQVSTNLAGMIEGFEYDWKRHKIPPRQLATADPLQFMLLDAVDQALQEAGLFGAKIDHERAGVVIGTIFGDEFAHQLGLGIKLPVFQQTLTEVLSRRRLQACDIERVCKQYEEVLLQRMPALIDETGSFTASTLASRITKTWNLLGGAVTVDAGDSSSTAAINCAVDLLRTRDSDLIVCAAGHRSLSFYSYHIHMQRGELAQKHPGVPFDASSSGMVPADGVGVVLLKRLSDAHRDGNKVFGVIRGVGTARQTALYPAIRLATQRTRHAAGISAEQVSLVEAGASGVPRRDTEEARGIADEYSSGRNAPLPVRAAAGQLGYCCGASGMISLLRASLELDRQRATPCPTLTSPAAYLAETHQLEISTEGRALPVLSADGAMYAAVNDQSGDEIAWNVLIERGERIALGDYELRQDYRCTGQASCSVSLSPAKLQRSKWQIVRAGAATIPALQQQLQKLRETAVSSFAAESQLRFHSDQRYRVAIVAGDPESLSEKLALAEKMLEAESGRLLLAGKGIFVGEVNPYAPAKIAFLFPGQGSQYRGMLRSLCEHDRAAADARSAIDSVLHRFKLPAFAELAWTDDEDFQSNVWKTQLSLLAADVIAMSAVTAQGVKADRVAGHSFGELAALVASGAWSFEQALLATCIRCRAIIGSDSERGLLVSTNAPVEELKDLCRQVSGRIYVSHVNAPAQTVAGGERSAVERLAALAAEKGFTSRVLEVPAAFHTSLLESAQSSFREGLTSISLAPPQIPFLSSVHNRYVADPDDIRELLVAQLTTPVDYVGLVERLYSEGVQLFVEVGPRQVLTGLHGQILNSQSRGEKRRLSEGSHVQQQRDRRLSPGSGDSAMPSRPVHLIGCDHPKRDGVEQILHVRACAEAIGALDSSRQSICIMDKAEQPTAGDAVASRHQPAPTLTAPPEMSNTKNCTTGRSSAACWSFDNRAEAILLSGTPFEIGHQHGRAQREEIRFALRRLADMAGSPWDRLVHRELTATELETFFGQDGIEEIRGISTGAEVPLYSIASLNVRLFLDAGGGGLHFVVDSPEGWLHAVNLENRRALPVADCLRQQIRIRRPDTGFPSVTFGFAGQIGTQIGMNMKGLAASGVALLDVPQRGPTEACRLLTVFVNRVLESAAGVDEAVALLRRDPGSTAWAVCITQASQKRIVLVEFDGREIRNREMPLPFVGTNHQLLVSTPHETPFSFSRHRRIQELVASAGCSAQLTVEAVQAILRDRFDQVRNCDLPHSTLGTICRVDNQASVVMQPALGKFWTTRDCLSDSSNTDNRFRLVDLQNALPGTLRAENAGTARDDSRHIASQVPSGRNSAAEAGDSVRKFIIAESDLQRTLSEIQKYESQLGPDRDFHRFVVRLLPQELEGAETGGNPDATIVLGANEVGRSLCRCIEQSGGRAVLLPASEVANETITALERAWSTGPVPHLIIVTPHDADVGTDAGRNDWARRRACGVMTPYLACQQWYRLVQEAGCLNGASLTVVTSLGGDFGLSGNGLGVESGFLAGLAKNLSIEGKIGDSDERLSGKTVEAPSGLRVRVIDFPHAALDSHLSPVGIAKLVLHECSRRNRRTTADGGQVHDVEIGYVNGRRHVVVPIYLPLRAPQRSEHANRRSGSVKSRDTDGDPRQAVSLDSASGAWIVTGGARGITAAAAAAVGRELGVALHLLGSTSPIEIPDTWHDLSLAELKELKTAVVKDAIANGETPIDCWSRYERAIEIDRTMRRLVRDGVRATYHQCDVSDQDALKDVLNRVRAADGPISGILHGAGYERAARFEKKRREFVERTLAAKADGANWLIQLTKDDPLEYFIGFSSVAARFGAFGLSDYAGANDLLGKIVDRLRSERPTCRAACFYWHLWDGVGMGVRPESKGFMQMMGFDFLPPEEGCRYLLDEIRAGLPEPEVIVTDWKFLKFHYFGDSPEFEAFRRMAERPQTNAPRMAGSPPSKNGGHPSNALRASCGNDRLKDQVQARPRASECSPVCNLSDLPFIDTVVEHQARHTLVAELHLHPTQDVFLNQHRMRGRPTMPLVGIIESFAEAASLFVAPKQVVGLTDVRAHHALRFLTDSPQTARVVIERQQDGTVTGTLSADVYNPSGRLLQKGRIYADCRVLLEEESTFPNDNCRLAESRQFEHRLPGHDDRSVSHGELNWIDFTYPESIPMGHGPAFRGLTGISLRDHGAFGRMTAVPAREMVAPRTGETLFIQPALLDSCFYLCGMYIFLENGGGIQVPEKIEEIRFGKLPADGGECIARMVRASNDGPRSSFDFTCTGSDGTVAFSVQGFCSVELPGTRHKVTVGNSPVLEQSFRSAR